PGELKCQVPVRRVLGGLRRSRNAVRGLICGHDLYSLTHSVTPALPFCADFRPGRRKTALTLAIPDLVERAREQRCRLRARGAQRLVEHEERTAVDADLPRLHFAPTALLGVGIAVEDLAALRRVEPGARRDLGEDVAVEDVPRLREVGLVDRAE